MSLSEQERRALEILELELTADDPRLSRRLAGGRPEPWPRRHPRLLLAVGVAAVVADLVAAALTTAFLALPAAAVVGIAAGVLLGRRVHPGRAGRASTRGRRRRSR
jgi:hypothetical protein